ncbi:MAG TPA: DNA polymerase III subunit gamma/tau [Opitutaceae bacterium]|nr:DNA polymerase III subunit gamma/tau [Opitutaceae bacterium]
MATEFPKPWPEPLTGTASIAVIDRAIARRRLSHSLLLTGDDVETLEQVAWGIADRLLNVPESSAMFPPENHPDCFSLRPAGKMRQISAEATRTLIGKVQVSANVSPRKVAIIHEADRMNLAAANIFLKTLEEPPANTTLILLTRRPYALLPTIRSRVLHFRFPLAAAPLSADGWSAWISDYQAWLGLLTGGPSTDKKATADAVFALYGLVARFGAILENATSTVWKSQKERLPPDLDDDEQVAIETGIANGIRLRLFADIAAHTRGFSLPRLTAGDDHVRRSLVAAIARLEHATGLLRVNLNESAALEDFLLSSLRIWSRRS